MDAIQSANNDIIGIFLHYHHIHMCVSCNVQSVCMAHTDALHASCSCFKLSCLQLQLAKGTTVSRGCKKAALSKSTSALGL